MTMDLETLRFAWTVLWPVLGVAVTWAIGRSKASQNEINGLRERIDQSERAIEAVKSELRHMPDRELTHRMEMSLGSMRGEIAVLAEQLKPVAAISQRLQEYLLDATKVR